MGLFHHDDEPHRRFKMQQKLVSIGDDYWIEDDDGHRAYKVNGKAARKRETFILEDLHGHKVARIQEKALSVRNKVAGTSTRQPRSAPRWLSGRRGRRSFHIGRSCARLGTQKAPPVACGLVTLTSQSSQLRGHFWWTRHTSRNYRLGGFRLSSVEAHDP